MNNPPRVSRRSRRNGRGNRNKVAEQVQINAIVKANAAVNPEPPTFEVSHHYVQRFRFVSQAEVTAYPINPSDFADLLLVASEASTPGSSFISYPVYTRFKLKFIEMWALPTSLAAPVTLVLTPQNVGTTTVNTERTLTDTSKSIDRYAYVKYKPKIDSPIYQYQSQDSTSAGVRLSCPAGTIVDVVLHVWIANGEVPDSVTLFSPAGTGGNIAAGQVFLSALDPSPTGSSLFPPVGYANAISDTVTPTPRP